MKFTEEALTLYAAPLSYTEDLMCKRTIEAIRDALKDLGYIDDGADFSPLEKDTYSYSLSMRSKNSSAHIHIFIQGSYANDTCVRSESDVDIAIIREDLSELAFSGMLDTSTTSKVKEAAALKNLIECILRIHFPNKVQRGNKSIKVAGNTSRKSADVVPCLSLQYYHNSHLKDFTTYHDGIVIVADDGSITRNFPKQHIINGKTKNSNTNYYYKKMVRIIKKMRNLMCDCGYTSANNVSSFGLESLVWNIPDKEFMEFVTYRYSFKHIISYLYNSKYRFSSYLEANGIKKLCPSEEDSQNYRAFVDDLNRFFDFDI